MKRKIILASSALLIAAVLSTNLKSNQVKAFPSGVSGYSGSAGNNNSNCTACHSGTASNSGASITSNIPAQGYIPGQTYTLTISGNDAMRNRFGFDLSAEDIAGTVNRGTFVITDSRTKLKTGEVTHNSPAMGTNKSISYNINWTAPAAGSGDVIFNVSLLAANGNGGTSGDQVHLASLTVPENTTGITSFHHTNAVKVYPNPATEKLTLSNLKNVEYITVSDMNGKTIVQQKIKNPTPLNLNISDYKKGIYIIDLFYNNGEHGYSKFVKL